VAEFALLIAAVSSIGGPWAGGSRREADIARSDAVIRNAEFVAALHVVWSWASASLR